MNKVNNYIIVETNNIGYQVFVNDSLFDEARISNEIEVYVYHRLKEDANDLYGFRTIEELSLFELLLTVSGVGPRSALGILNIAAISDIVESIIQGSADLLIKVSGIGQRTAERIVLELKNKLLKVNGGISTGASLGGDEIEALMSLGYSLPEAREALKNVDKKITDSGQRIKEALKNISR